jgi:hypothetical protein
LPLDHKTIGVKDGRNIAGLTYECDDDYTFVRDGQINQVVLPDGIHIQFRGIATMLQGGKLFRVLRDALSTLMQVGEILSGKVLSPAG